MITQPMAALKLRFAADELVMQIAERTGGRANLIAIACNAVLKNLDPGARIITETEVEKALSDRELRDELDGWKKMSEQEQANRLDQIIVYATAPPDDFSLAELLELLDAKRCAYDPADVDTSLLTRLRKFRGRLPDGFYFDRLEAHERD